jgi:hypothetical protein
MKISPYIDKLNHSEQFKDFQKKFNDAFIVAGFFIIDYEAGKNTHQIDYYIPSKKKVAAFTLDGQVTFQLLDMMNNKVPEKLDMKTNVDLDQIHGILEDEMKNRSITEQIKKIIAVVQSLDGKKIWNLSCILSGMGILTAHVEDESRSVLKMEKKSMMDIMKKLPASAIKNSQMNAKDPKQFTKEEAEVTIKKLDQLEKQREKEKEMIIKEMNKKEPKSSQSPKKPKALKKVSKKK